MENIIRKVLHFQKSHISEDNKMFKYDYRLCSEESRTYYFKTAVQQSITSHIYNWANI